MQPWRLSVVDGEACRELSKLLLDLHDQGLFEAPHYTYSPKPLPPGWKDRARECGYLLYDLKGIDKNDKAATTEHYRENYAFFGARTVLFFFLPKSAEPGNFLDLGFFMQNVMLGLLSLGIGSCPQVSMTRFSDTIRSRFGADDEILIAGMSIGYPDESAPVNTYIPPRLPLDQYTRWHP